MESDVKKSKEMYNDFRFGDFSYGDKRYKLNPLLLEFLKMVKGNSLVYDIGCGVGFWFDLYMKYGVNKENVRGVDLSPINVENLNNNGFNVSCGNVLDLNLNDNVSDFTICNGVIHHTPDPFKAFSELVRITKPGGYIFLNVYNIWHPYYYIVHKATFPLRYIYWNINKKVVDIIFPIMKIFYQPLSYLVFKQFIDNKTAKIMFMDQVITPHAKLFSKFKINSFAKKTGVKVVKFQYNKYGLLISAIIKIPLK